MAPNGPMHDVAMGSAAHCDRLPGFEGLYDLLHDSRDAGRRFLFDGPLRVAFFGQHLNSSDGDTPYALELSGRRLVRLSPNWAPSIPLLGEPTFRH